ncbi:MAG: HpcH/HpaI aldolase/citrate lyase family protein [Burkholderiales bacterium]|jgi:4-hydroxy-2-oxoheptanedioate aldolase|nr:HpcH/HpaI aldolase/citrate lyase family protein [Burkholderiales bacterium]
MQLPHNPFKKALIEGRAPIGLWASLPSPYAVEVIAGAGFDWLLIDTEHTPADIETVLAELQAVAGYPSHPVVRLPWNDFVAVKRYLDIGALTLMIPQIGNADEARAAVAAMRYPPGGVRGVGGTTRATRFGRVDDYARRAEEELCLLVQVETREALDEIEAIAAVDGVDGIFIGPADLHASFGHVGERANPAVMARIDDGIRRIRAAGKAPGILTSNEADARRWLALGAQFVAVGSDVGLLARSADALAARFRT